MERQTFRILTIPLSTSGHINPILALTTALKKRNHEVIFAIEKDLKGKLAKYGFQEVILQQDDDDEGVEVEQSHDKSPSEQWVDLMKEIGTSFGADPYDTIMKCGTGFAALAEKMKTTNTQVAQVIEKTKPDIILYDQHVWHPAVPASGVPFVHFMPANPLPVLQGENLIPSYFGLPLDTSPEDIAKYKRRKEEAFEKTWNDYADFVTSTGGPLPHRGMLRYFSNNLNIFLYPQRLARDYLDRSTNGSNWIGIDHAIRPSDDQYLIPQDFQALPGKTVFLSMGTLGSLYIELMKRLVDMLDKSSPNYKFIVSKGILADKYELAKNMIGEAYVPQLGILPQVDLAIIHGGNNTFTEAIYFGKPMIVIPLFADQLDNAQRAVDARIGARFNPFTQSGEELIQLMDKVLNDEEIMMNVQEMSKESSEINSIEKAIDSIESVARNPKTPTFV